MPLSALVNYGKELVERGILPPLGWSSVKAPYAIQLNESGELIGIQDLRTTETIGTRTISFTPSFNVPYRTSHQASIQAFCLCDKAEYLLGLSAENAEDRKQKALKRYDALVKLHEEVLTNVQSKAATALRTFFSSWHPSMIDAYQFLLDVKEDLLAVTSIVIQVDGSYVHDDPLIMSAWDAYYAAQLSGDDVPTGTCMVTGEENVPLARIHPPVTGVVGAQSAGAYLVSFGDPDSAYNYWGKVKGENAPTGIATTAHYGNALTYLMKTPSHRKIIGNTTVCFWAADGSDLYSEAFSMASYGRQPHIFKTPEDEALYSAISAMVDGKSSAEALKEYALDMSKDFYVMGIRPHSARLSLVFFWKGTFGDIFSHIEDHYRRIELCRWDKDEPLRLSCDDLLSSLSVKDKSSVSPSVEDALMQSVYTGTPYPYALLTIALNRIRTDHSVTAARTAILKCILLRNGCSPSTKEVLTVALNPDSTSMPYLLGQLFSWLESLQKETMPHIQRSLKDTHFSAFASHPAQQLSKLDAKTNYYIGKLKRSTDKSGLGYYYEQQLAELYDKMTLPLPIQLNAEEQSAFVIGYYHAVQNRFQSKSEKKSTKNK